MGEPGRRALYRAIPELKAEYGADAVIVNGENAAGGRGITPPLVNEFFEHGVAAITLGDHVWDQQSLADQIDTLPGVLRPLNLQSNNPGKGSCIIHTPKGDVGVICLIGRTFMRYAAENPFLAAENAVEPLHAQGIHTILVDIHAEATSEKISLALHLAGHTHPCTNGRCPHFTRRHCCHYGCRHVRQQRWCYRQRCRASAASPNYCHALQARHRRLPGPRERRGDYGR